MVRPMVSPSPNDPDAVLMLRFCGGDETAFDQLVDKFKEPVLNYVCRQIGNVDEVEDIAQNVFAKFAKARSVMNPAPSLPSGSLPSPGISA